MTSWRFGVWFGTAFLAGLGLLSQTAGRADDKTDPEPPPDWPKTVAADRAVSASNLKLIGIAFHNFHDQHGAFPANAIRDKAGKPLLSWRVALLPYLDEEKLFKQFKLDEPWDSKHNKTLIAKMPKVYLVGKPLKANTTYYQLFTGAGTVFDPKAARGQGFTTLGMRITDLTDGTSHTALAIEGGDAVTWTKPEDIAYDANKAIPKVGGLFKEGFHVLLGDGDVKRIGRKADGINFRRLITPNDGVATDWQKLPEPDNK